MMRHPPRTILASTALAMALPVALTVAPVVGCAKDRSGELRGARSIEPTDFLSNDEQPAQASPATSRGDATPDAREPRELAEDDRWDDLVVTPGAPQLSGPAPRAVDESVLIEAKIGDINGKPVYANDFFEPMAARIRAYGEEAPRAQWESEVRRAIRRQLDTMVADEILRAEALARLSPEQRQGLRALLERVRSDLLSQNYGSERLAQQRLLEREGVTIDQRLQQDQERELVQYEISQEIGNRINVSWRDIVQRYERDAEIYNPPPTARFRLIRVRTSDTDGVAEVTRRLAEGEPFESVAASELNGFSRDEGGLYEQQIEGSLETTEFFGNETLNENAQSLSIGEVAGPFEFGPLTGWLLLESIERDSIPLYEAQLAISAQIRGERREAEIQRHLDRLVERASITDVREMEQRLFDIAVERYAPEAPRGPRLGG